MKSVIGAYIIVIILILFVILNSVIVSYNIKEVIKMLENVQDTSESGEKYIEIYEDYERRQKYISLTVNHNDLSAIETEFAEILGSVEACDYENLTIAKSRLIGALKHLKRLSGINIDSIF